MKPPIVTLAPVLAVALLGCGKTVPPPQAADSPTTEDAAVDRPPPGAGAALAGDPDRESEAEVDPEAVGRDDDEVTLRWSVEGRPDAERVAVGPEGRVAVLTDGHLALRDGRGKLIAERPSCRGVGMAFLGTDRLAVVCERELVRHRLPGLEPELRQPLAAEASRAVFSPDHLAIAFADRTAMVYEIATLKQTDGLTLGAPATALALDEEGRHLYVGLDDGHLIARDRETRVTERRLVKTALPVQALALSRDDRRLLVSAGPMVEIWSTDGRKTLRRFTTVGGVDEAGWLVGGRVASVGRDGLLQLDPATGGARSFGGGVTTAQPGSHLAVGPEGENVCVLEPDGRLSCYGRGGAATRQVVRPIPGGVGATATNGKIVTYADERLEVRLHPRSPVPVAGTLVRVYRYREVDVGGVRSVRWIDTTEGEVEEIEGQVLRLEVGALRNADGLAPPLAPDVPVKLIWLPAPPAAPEAAPSPTMGEDASGSDAAP